MKKPFTVGNVREIMDAQARGEISYSKMVERFNQIAFDFFKPKQPQCYHSNIIYKTVYTRDKDGVMFLTPEKYFECADCGLHLPILSFVQREYIEPQDKNIP